MPNRVCSDMTGVVLELAVAPGDEVAAGGLVVVVESMKLEVEVVSPWSGVVTGVDVAVGDSITEGQVLAHIEPAGAGA